MKIIVDIEPFPYCTANHAWFLYGLPHWVDMGLKKVFITANFKLESDKMFLKKCC